MLRILQAAGRVGAALAVAAGSAAHGEDFKIDVIFDEAGPFAGGGSKAKLIGARLAIDLINARGGVEGYRIVPTHADGKTNAVWPKEPRAAEPIPPFPAGHACAP